MQTNIYIYFVEDGTVDGKVSAAAAAYMRQYSLNFHPNPISKDALGNLEASLARTTSSTELADALVFLGPFWSVEYQPWWKPAAFIYTYDFASRTNGMGPVKFMSVLADFPLVKCTLRPNRLPDSVGDLIDHLGFDQDSGLYYEAVERESPGVDLHHRFLVHYFQSHPDPSKMVEEQRIWNASRQDLMIDRVAASKTFRWNGLLIVVVTASDLIDMTHEALHSDRPSFDMTVVQTYTYLPSPDKTLVNSSVKLWTDEARKRGTNFRISPEAYEILPTEFI